MSQDPQNIEQLERRDTSTDKRVILAVVGKHGGVHYWHEQSTMPSSGRDKFGGIEIHYANRPSWADDERPPDNEKCWLLNAPCWHDGSSLQAEETYTPLWESCSELGDMEYFWLTMEERYRSQFEEIDNG